MSRSIVPPDLRLNKERSTEPTIVMRRRIIDIVNINIPTVLDLSFVFNIFPILHLNTLSLHRQIEYIRIFIWIFQKMQM
jgi:hypothetical protein